MIPRERTIYCVFDFTLVDWLVSSDANEFADKEEIVSIGGAEVSPQLKAHLLIVLTLLFVSSDSDSTGTASGSLIADEVVAQSLVSCCDDFVKLEFAVANLFVIVTAVGVTEIIGVQLFDVDIVNNDLVVLTLLEVVLYVDALYPLWVEFANDGLCLSNFVPRVDVLGE